MNDANLHAGHGDGMHHGGDQHMCSMSMLFTWDTTDLCIVFRQWHVRSAASLLLSLFAVVVLAMGYEALRALSRRYEAKLDQRLAAMPRLNLAATSRRGHLIKAVLYALQNFYAFMLMLFFMTYNGWVMLAVTAGAFLGYLSFGQTTSATKDNACH